ncbi:tRNA-specific 2-thiouridylase MnmA [uncultured delta proteobacterium]|uniref:tRNA-uridine 2-sulfurtransferase n=1 Tax=uncultured delta proteobacterium TaxID=34034 RepID=A0A212JWZ9_9DELT|nr:tRNA-specific 2-thiouridylase MnmA [uncultured delta proteobacterium]
MLGNDGITAVAVSGGVDSLYALVSLKERGEAVLALHGRMLPPDLAPAGYEAMLERLAKTCAALDVPLAVIDCVDAFAEAVINPFVRAYAAGTTPNPCAHCNVGIKFGLLLDTARDLGATRLATGHYVRLEQSGNTPALYAGQDASKDQSYFLSLVPLEKLRFAVAPLARKSKDEIRAALAAKGITPPAPGESQEICFVPNDDYRAFLLDRAAKLGVALPGPGPVTLPDGKRIGTHNGLWQYTEGQRKGLGIAWSEPLYVLAKDLAANALVTGGGACLHGGEIRAGNCNFLVPMAEWPETLLLRTRFRQTPRPARARFEDGVLILREETPSGPYARGQIAAVYGPDLRVLAGGVIE